MSEFIIGSGRIGPGAAPKMQNPHEPSTTRSRRDSTRILTTARHSCLIGHYWNPRTVSPRLCVFESLQRRSRLTKIHSVREAAPGIQHRQEDGMANAERCGGHLK